MNTKKNEEYLDFMTYVLIHAAVANDEIAPADEMMIKNKATAGEYREVMAEYKKHSASERKDYLTRMRNKWLQNDYRKTGLALQVQRLTGVDLVLRENDNPAYSELNKIILA